MRRLVALALTVACVSAHANLVTLTCRDDERPLAEKLLRVDYSRNTVDGVPATVTDTLVEWSSARSVFGETIRDIHRISRVSGHYWISPEPIFLKSGLPALPLVVSMRCELLRQKF